MPLYAADLGFTRASLGVDQRSSTDGLAGAGIFAIWVAFRQVFPVAATLTFCLAFSLHRLTPHSSNDSQNLVQRSVELPPAQSDFHHVTITAQISKLP